MGEEKIHSLYLQRKDASSHSPSAYRTVPYMETETCFRFLMATGKCVSEKRVFGKRVSVSTSTTDGNGNEFPFPTNGSSDHGLHKPQQPSWPPLPPHCHHRAAATYAAAAPPPPRHRRHRRAAAATPPPLTPPSFPSSSLLLLSLPFLSSLSLMLFVDC